MKQLLLLKVQTFTATTKGTGIELTWTNPADDDLWGYIIGYCEVQ